MTKVAVVEIAAIPEYGYVGPDMTMLLVLVNKEEAVPGRGDEILADAARHFPSYPGMLVAIGDNGYIAYAPFQTHRLLVQVQMLQVTWTDVDLDSWPEDTSEVPF